MLIIESYTVLILLCIITYSTLYCIIKYKLLWSLPWFLELFLFVLAYIEFEPPCWLLICCFDGVTVRLSADCAIVGNGEGC